MADFCEQLDKKSQAMNAAKMALSIQECEFSSKIDIFIQKACNPLYFYIKRLKMNRKCNLIGLKILRKSSQVQYGRSILVSIGQI
jgi:hypothetical protein